MLMAALSLVAVMASDVTVRNQKLFVGTEQYFVKGVLYNPVPLGQYRMTPDGLSTNQYLINPRC